jgi:hypothetical protein
MQGLGDTRQSRVCSVVRLSLRQIEAAALNVHGTLSRGWLQQLLWCLLQQSEGAALNAT